MKNKKILALYDISDRKIRYRVHKILKSWRIGGQKSVHECILDTDRAQELFIRICGDINPKTDSLMMVRIEPHRKTLYRGIGKEVVKNAMVHVG